MGFISKILGSVLVLVISGVTLAFILSATLFNADYYKAKASELHLYSQLSLSIPSSLGHDDPATQQALTNIVSSQYVQSKLNPFLDQLQQYYFNNGPAPTIDFSDLVAEAQRQGVTVPPNAAITKPVVFNDPTGIKQQLGWINFMKTWGLIIALALAAAIALVNKGAHRFSALGKVLIVAGIWDAVIFLLLKLGPGLVESLIKNNNQVGPLGPVMISFFSSVMRDISQDFMYVAIGLAAAGAGLIIAAFGLRAAGIFKHKEGGSASKWVRPSTNDRPTIH